MNTGAPSAIVRVRKANGEIVGAGFLVSKNHILTCAHVVNGALNKPLTATDRPFNDIEIYLDFPQAAPGKILTAQIIHWLPVQPNDSTLLGNGSDIAVLELQGNPPNNTQPVLLIKAKNLWGYRFRLFGFPTGRNDGVWTNGELRHSTGDGRVQMEIVQETAYRVESGFSGAPVWDKGLKNVVGMTVTAEMKRQDVKAAFMIPTNQLLDACPWLKDIQLKLSKDRRKKQRRIVILFIIASLATSLFSLYHYIFRDKIEGIYEIRSTNYSPSQGEMEYDGSLEITRHTVMPVYQLTWQTRSVYTGVGILQGDILSGTWSWNINEEKCYVVTYQPVGDGMLDGRFFANGEKGLGIELGSRKEVLFNADGSLAGTYKIVGRFSDGKNYEAILQIEPTNIENGYTLTWTMSNNKIEKGLGILRGNILSSSRGGSKCGTISYLVESNKLLDGLWGSLYSQERFGTELARPR